MIGNKSYAIFLCRLRKFLSTRKGSKIITNYDDNSCYISEKSNVFVNVIKNDDLKIEFYILCLFEYKH